MKVTSNGAKLVSRTWINCLPHPTKMTTPVRPPTTMPMTLPMGVHTSLAGLSQQEPTLVRTPPPSHKLPLLGAGLRPQQEPTLAHQRVLFIPWMCVAQQEPMLSHKDG